MKYYFHFHHKHDKSLHLKLLIIIDYLKKIPGEFTQEPWVNVLWNPNTNRVTGAKSERNFIAEAICLSSGLAKTSMTKGDMKKKYGEYYGKANKEFPVY